MPATAKANLQGALFALLAFALFSTHDALVKTLGAIYTPFQIIFFSVLLSFPLATIMLMRDMTNANLRPHHPWWTAIRTGAAMLTGVSAFYAFSVLPLAQTYAILFATPLLITVLAVPILKERVGIHRFMAVLLGLAGVFVVLRPGTAELGLGHLAALTAAGGAAVSSVIVRKIGKDERSAVLLLYPMVGNFVLMATIMPFVYEPIPAEHFGMLGLISILAFGAMLCVIAAYRAADAAVVAPMQYSQIVWATGFGALFFAETPDTQTLIGAGIVILSGIYIVLRESLSGNSANTPVLETRSRPETGTAPRVGPVMDLRKPA